MVTTNTNTIVAMHVRIVRTLLRRRFLKMSRRNFIVAFGVPVDSEKRAENQMLKFNLRIRGCSFLFSSIRNSKFNAGYSPFLDRRKPALGSLSFRDLIH